MNIPKELAEQKVSLAVVAFVIGVFTWSYHEFVHAEDFKKYQLQVERGRLETERRAIDRSITALEAKKAANNGVLKPEEKAVLESSQAQVKEINNELKSLRGF